MIKTRWENADLATVMRILHQPGNTVLLACRAQTARGAAAQRGRRPEK